MIARYAAPLALALLSLGACNKAPEAPAVAQTQGGVLITGGRLVLPAVAGNPGAAYFTLSNQAASATSITSVEIAGAKSAEMHVTSGATMDTLQKLDVAAGESVLFAAGGKHVMVFGLPDNIKAGASVEITLRTADGKLITGQLMAEGAGGAMASGHDGMKM